jgi:hypothetical protein
MGNNAGGKTSRIVEKQIVGDTGQNAGQEQVVLQAEQDCRNEEGQLGEPAEGDSAEVWGNDIADQKRAPEEPLHPSWITFSWRKRSNFT